MTRTDTLFLATEKYYNTYDGYPNDTAQSVESRWNWDVAVNGDYDISISANGYVTLDDPDTVDSALIQVGESSTVEQHLNSYDAVVVIDDRVVSGGDGKAKLGTVGGDRAYAYVQDDVVITAAHELGHIYGVSHEGDDTHWQNTEPYRHGLMGYDGVDPSCNGLDPNIVRDNVYGDCARNRIRDVIDSNL
jgi:hypothetical protein